MTSAVSDGAAERMTARTFSEWISPVQRQRRGIRRRFWEWLCLFRPNPEICVFSWNRSLIRMCAAVLTAGFSHPGVSAERRKRAKGYPELTPRAASGTMNPHGEQTFGQEIGGAGRGETGRPVAARIPEARTVSREECDRSEEHTS